MNQNVTQFLNELNHPLREEIDLLRSIILQASTELTENIKWNAPNYAVIDKDRITLKIQPPKAISVVFHCGAKLQKQLHSKLIDVKANWLEWKSNDRAVATFKNMAEIHERKSELQKIVAEWIKASV